MGIKIVSDDLFSFLLGQVTGVQFESFAKLIFSAVFGESFVPLGGIHDGGADGSMSSYVQEVHGKSQTFAQFSIRDDVKTKIGSTIDSLKKSVVGCFRMKLCPSPSP
jgi:hypothetical protein